MPPRKIKTKTLDITHPELAKEWNYEKNGDLKPSDISFGSNKKIWWRCNRSKCQHSHEWITSITSRTGQVKTKCPFCQNFKVCPCKSIEILYPEISKQWHPTKNKGINPSECSIGSGKKIWWLCDKSQCSHPHEWRAPINGRIRGTNCRFCVGMSICECNSLGKKFPEIAAQWHPTKNGDISPMNIAIFSNKKFWWKCDKSNCIHPHEWNTTVANRTAGKRNCPFCKKHKYCECESFGGKFPEIAKYWHPEKNGKLKPTDVSPHSGEKVWWLCDHKKCEHKHEWYCSVSTLTGKAKLKCPYCYGYKYDPCDSFGKLFPMMATEWHPTKNGNVKPTDVAPHTAKVFWWLCKKSTCEHPHEWAVSVDSRTRKNQITNCPFCAYQKSCPCMMCPSCQLFRTKGELCTYCKPRKLKYIKTKEMKAVRHLRDTIPEHSFIHNKSVGSECTEGHLFPDIRYDCITYQLIVEIDENQHRGADYACDKRRMYDIIAKLGQPCAFIRYNPDSKKSNLAELTETVKNMLETNDGITWDEYGFAVKYMFYNVAPIDEKPDKEPIEELSEESGKEPNEELSDEESGKEPIEELSDESSE